MQFGFCLPTFESIATREIIARTAHLAEEQGWDSIWVTDHVVMSAGQEHPYGHIFEALSTLAYAAALTQRVLLGTSVIVLPQRSAVVVAKEAATIDALSNGRLILGVAAGWNDKEFAFIGADFHRRGRVLEEQIAAMRALWTQQSPSFHGKRHHFEDALFSPKPAQPSGIPIWIGGNSDFALQRAVRIGDGWHLTGMPPERFEQARDLIAHGVGARPFALSARLEVDMSGSLPTQFSGPDGTQRRRLGGTSADMARDLERYARVGVSHVVLVLRDDEPDSLVLHMTQIAHDVIPQFRGKH